MLSNSDIALLDRIQRKAARMLLGFSRRSPTPAVLLELGWSPWSARLPCERLRLYGRLAVRNNNLVQVVLRALQECDSPWLADVLVHKLRLQHSPTPCESVSWSKGIKQLLRSHANVAFHELRVSCKTHHNLAHYPMLPGMPCINRMLHDKKIPVDDAKFISRFICGGQGLRGGDPVQPPEVSAENCCVSCLRNGRLAVETLYHVLAECPAYTSARLALYRHVNTSTDVVSLCTFSRDRWSWQQLKIIRRFFLDIIFYQKQSLKDIKQGRKNTQEIITRIWNEHHEAGL